MNVLINKIFRLIFTFATLLFFEKTANAHLPLLVHGVGDHGGMFAEFASVLGALKSYEEGKYAGVQINFTNGFYLDPVRGPNWWNYYFEPISLGNRKRVKHHCTSDEYISLAHIGFGLPRSEAFDLIDKYIHLKDQISTEIDAFVSAHFTGNHVIGVHFRGTDKVLEYPRIAYERVYECLQHQIQLLSPEQMKRLKIYVATDEKDFLDYLLERIPDLLLYNDFVRSNDKRTPLHYENNFFTSNYQKGREALVDCVLLSRCDLLLRSFGSCFSWASTLFNPNLPSIDY